MLRVFARLLFLHLCTPGYGQDTIPSVPSNPIDSVQLLEEVMIQAFEYGRPLQEIPVSIGILASKDFERFNNTSFVPAMNTIPGVRMEERSPGSYRLSIRGSTLRSPFGIRNVKVYWCDLPFTDPGGNTYLNLLDFNSIENAEIIKGPGSSLYGAGTGGVVLLKKSHPKFNQNAFQFSTVGGSFGLLRYTLGAQSSSEKLNTKILYAHQQTDGYREQSKMVRDAFQLEGSFNVNNKQTFAANILFARLNYQTPGGLTKAQYDENPKQARPAGGPIPGAVEQHAAIENQTVYAGLSQTYDFNPHWSNRTGLYGTFTQFENSAIRNFERKVEQGFGLRSVTQYASEKFKFNIGAEFQSGFSPIGTYANLQGHVGDLQTDDEISSHTAFLFAQTDFILPLDFYLTIGSSLNFSKISFTRLSAPYQEEVRKFKPVLSPRIALTKKINASISVYGSFSQGFSPPTVAEILPSSAVFNPTLNPEKGNNYELGVRGSALRNLFTFDFTAYNFQLKQAISLRRTEDGADYFVNAGGTSQSGLELTLAFTPHTNENSFVQDLKFWTSITATNYRFTDYIKDTINLSDNKLTGVAPNIVVIGLDVLLKAGFYSNITFNYTDRMPLDDINSAFADSYMVVGARAGYRLTLKKIELDFLGGIDNALDVRYSLGNDLNAPGNTPQNPAGQKFYNPAAGRNFFIGLKTNLITRKSSK